MLQRILTDYILIQLLLKDNLVEGGVVYILGGYAAVSQKLDTLLSDYNVKRLAGDDRYETNLLILEEAGITNGSDILVCTALEFADSLSASAVGMPILLVSDDLSNSQKNFLQSISGCKYTLIGGTSAIGNTLMNELNLYGQTVRLAGSNRFETSIKVAETFFVNVDNISLTYAMDFPDGLCGGPLAYIKKSPMILTMSENEAEASKYVKTNNINKVLILGGNRVISLESLDKIFNINN